MSRARSEKPNRRVSRINKADAHADAEHETQLVNIENHQTLEGKIDLTKVRDIRRALRRRYASRKNYQSIFKAWDKKKNGINLVDNRPSRGT